MMGTFPNHGNSQGKGYVIMGSTSAKDAKGGETCKPSEPDLDKMTRWMQILYKLKNFYDQMEFSP